MNQLPTVEPATAQGRARELLDAVQQKLGVTPNMVKAMANSPALLQGYLDFSAALSSGAIPAATAERVALTVAEHKAAGVENDWPLVRPHGRAA